MEFPLLKIATFAIVLFVSIFFFSCGDLFRPSIIGDLRCNLNLQSDGKESQLLLFSTVSNKYTNGIRGVPMEN